MSETQTRTAAVTNSIGELPDNMRTAAYNFRNRMERRAAAAAAVTVGGPAEEGDTARPDQQQQQQQQQQKPQQQRPPLPPTPPPRPEWTRRVIITTTAAEIKTTCSHNGPDNVARTTSAADHTTSEPTSKSAVTVNTVGTPISSSAVVHSRSGSIVTAKHAAFAASAVVQQRRASLTPPPPVRFPRHRSPTPAARHTYVTPRPVPKPRAPEPGAAVQPSQHLVRQQNQKPQQPLFRAYPNRLRETSSMSVASMVRAMNSRDGETASVSEQIRLLERVAEENGGGADNGGEVARRHGSRPVGATAAARAPLILPPTTQAPPPPPPPPPSPVIQVEPTLAKYTARRSVRFQLDEAIASTSRPAAADCPPSVKKVRSYVKDPAKKKDADDKVPQAQEVNRDQKNGKNKNKEDKSKVKAKARNDVQEETRYQTDDAADGENVARAHAQREEETTSCGMSCLMFFVDSCECNIM